MNETQILLIKKQLFLKGFETNTACATSGTAQNIERFLNRDDASVLIFGTEDCAAWTHTKDVVLARGQGFQSLLTYLQDLRYARRIPISPYVDFE